MKATTYATAGTFYHRWNESDDAMDCGELVGLEELDRRTFEEWRDDPSTRLEADLDELWWR